MERDILSRRAVNDNLRRITRKRMKGRKLVGVKFDPDSKAWYVVLPNGKRALLTTRHTVDRSLQHAKSSVARARALSDKD